MSHAKYPVLKAKILEDLSQRRLGADQALPTEAHYAARFKTTAKTVRRALRELASEGLLSHARGRRSVLRREAGWDRRVPFLVGAASAAVGGIFGSIVAGMREAASAHGVELVLRENDENPERIRRDAQELLKSGARVILHAPIGSSTKEAQAVDAWLTEAVAKARARLITVDRRQNGAAQPSVSHVACDNRAGGARAAQELAAAGYREAWWVMLGGRETSASEDRVEGFRAGLRQAGLAAPRALVLGKKEDGGAFLKSIASGKPQGAFILADYVALHFMAFLREKGVALLPPEKLGLITFDDLEVSRAFGLAVVDQPLLEIGRQAMNLAVGYLSEPTAPSREILLPPTFLSRPSFMSISPSRSA